MLRTALGRNDFDHGILTHTGHRPWSMPRGPWIMTQSWHDLLFAHWPVGADLLGPLVPSVFPLDRFEGESWVGIIPFHMTNVAPRGVPALPRISAFPELNVRTYVTLDGRPGIYFFSLDAGNELAVHAARLLFNLPYHSATMRVSREDGWTVYSSKRRSRSAGRAEFAGRYRPTGAVAHPAAGTLEHFLTERYCLYEVDRRGHPYRVEIHHPPWPLQAAELETDRNTMAESNGLPGLNGTPLLHFSRRQDMVAWLPTRLGAKGLGMPAG